MTDSHGPDLAPLAGLTQHRAHTIGSQNAKAGLDATHRDTMPASSPRLVRRLWNQLRGYNAPVAAQQQAAAIADQSSLIGAKSNAASRAEADAIEARAIEFSPIEFRPAKPPLSGRERTLYEQKHPAPRSSRSPSYADHEHAMRHRPRESTVPRNALHHRALALFRHGFSGARSQKQVLPRGYSRQDLHTLAVACSNDKAAAKAFKLARLSLEGLGAFKSVTAHQVRRVTSEVEKARTAMRQQNSNRALAFVKSEGWSAVFNAHPAGLLACEIRSGALIAQFHSAVGAHTGFARGPLSYHSLEQLAHDAIQAFADGQQRRREHFCMRYPDLTQYASQFGQGKLMLDPDNFLLVLAAQFYDVQAVKDPSYEKGLRLPELSRTYRASVQDALYTLDHNAQWLEASILLTKMDPEARAAQQRQWRDCALETARCRQALAEVSLLDDRVETSIGAPGLSVLLPSPDDANRVGEARGGAVADQRGGNHQPAGVFTDHMLTQLLEASLLRTALLNELTRQEQTLRAAVSSTKEQP